MADPATQTVAVEHGAGPEATGREPIFAGLPEIDLDLASTDVLDARLVALEYRPVTGQAT